MALSHDHFRREVLWRTAESMSHRALTQELGEAKVCETDVALRVKQYILGL